MGSSKRHRGSLVALSLAIAVILRLYPYFYYGVPWGTDAWPLIRNANEILLHTPTTLGGNAVFDSYNIYWPAASLFGASGSLIFGIPAIQVISILVPLAAAFSALFFFLIVEKLTKNSLVACIASLFFTSAGFDAIFTASATKETFAYPFFMLAILILLLGVNIGTSTLFALVSVTLALSHHVTTLILLTILAAILISDAIHSLAGISRLTKRYIFPLMLVIIFAIDYELYAKTGWNGGGTPPIPFVAIIPASAIFFISLALSIYFSLARKIRSMIFEGIAIICASFALLFASTQISILPFAPVLPSLIALLAVPYLVVGFVAIFGYKIMHDEMDRSSFVITSSWLAATLALLLFTMIGTPDGVFLMYRFFTFIYAPVAIFAAIALIGFFGIGKSSYKSIIRIVVVLSVISIVALSSYMSYASVVDQENLLAGHYAYTQSDFGSANFVSKVFPSNSTIAADSMIQDLYTGYFGLSVNPNQGYRYVLGLDQLGRNSSEMLVTYALMNDQGYDLVIYGLPVPNDWLPRISSNSSLLYNNGNVMIWK